MTEVQIHNKYLKEAIERNKRYDNCRKTGWSDDYMGFPNRKYFDKDMNINVTSNNYTAYWFCVMGVTICSCDDVDCKCPEEDLVCILYGSEHSWMNCSHVHTICKLTDIWSD